MQLFPASCYVRPFTLSGPNAFLSIPFSNTLSFYSPHHINDGPFFTSVYVEEEAKLNFVHFYHNERAITVQSCLVSTDAGLHNVAYADPRICLQLAKCSQPSVALRVPKIPNNCCLHLRLQCAVIWFAIVYICFCCSLFIFIAIPFIPST